MNLDDDDRPSRHIPDSDELAFKAKLAALEQAGVPWREAYRRAARELPDVYRRLQQKEARRGR